LKAPVPLLLLGLAGCVSGASDAAAATLAVKYRVGDQQTYRFHQVFTGALSSADGHLQPVTFDVRAVETTQVTAVAADGSATLDVQLLDLSGTSDGQQLPLLGTQRYQLRMGADGRILEGGVGVSGSSTLSVPSADQTFAILPDHKVKPGDGWTRDYERPDALGSGSLKVHSENRWLRYEQLSGTRAAVVQSRLSTPIDQELTVGGQSIAGNRHRHGGRDLLARPRRRPLPESVVEHQVRPHGGRFPSDRIPDPGPGTD